MGAGKAGKLRGKHTKMVHKSWTVLQSLLGLAGLRYLEEANRERVELLGTELVRINFRMDFTCGEAGTEYSQYVEERPE